MAAKSFIRWLKDHGACPEGLKWLRNSGRTDNPLKAWDECDNLAFMLWVLTELAQNDSACSFAVNGRGYNGQGDACCLLPRKKYETVSNAYPHLDEVDSDLLDEGIKYLKKHMKHKQLKRALRRYDIKF